MEQRSEEWFAARAGKFTASRVGALMAVGRNGKPLKGREELISTLAVERLTGHCVETYSNAAMQRGTEMEPEARDAYVFETGHVVEEVAFVEFANLPNTGCSPDGLIGDDGMVEIKCPSAMNRHIGALRNADHAKEYRWQLQHQLLCTGRDWVDIVSYDPRFPASLQLAIHRVERDNGALEELTKAIGVADKEVEALVEELRKMGGK